MKCITFGHNGYIVCEIVPSCPKPNRRDTILLHPSHGLYWGFMDRTSSFEVLIVNIFRTFTLVLRSNSGF